jgi:hypothetical protein
LRPPKHIRDSRKAALLAAERDYHENGAPSSRGGVGYADNGRSQNLGYRTAYLQGAAPQSRIHFSREDHGGHGGLLKGDFKRMAPKNSEIYNEKLSTKHGPCTKTKVRTGTTKPHWVQLTSDTGEQILIWVAPKPRWSEVGLIDSIPNDGGVGTIGKDGKEIRPSKHTVPRRKAIRLDERQGS